MVKLNWKILSRLFKSFLSFSLCIIFHFSFVSERSAEVTFPYLKLYLYNQDENTVIAKMTTIWFNNGINVSNVLLYDIKYKFLTSFQSAK